VLSVRHLKEHCEPALVGFLMLWMALGAGCGSRPSDAARHEPEEAPSSIPVGDGPARASAALLEVAFDGHTGRVRETLERGADPSAVGEDGRTALMLAAFGGHTEILRALLEDGAAVDDRDGFGRTALMYAASGPNDDSVRLLLEWKADPNIVDREERFTALMFACAEGHGDVVRTLLEYGSDPDRVDVDGDTALDFATRNGHGEVVRILSDRDETP
jgi:ankyrin repeat protein